MSTKFEQLLDYLVNEETAKANELFHEIVVEKSREIYENLIAEEETEEEAKEAADTDEDAVEEGSDDTDEDPMEEAQDEEADESVEESMFGEEEEEFPVQDKTVDFASDVADDDAMGGDDEFGGEEGGDAPATKDDVLDLKDALEELQAEFEALMSAEKNEEENEPGVHDDEEGDSPLDSMDDEEGEEEEGEKKEGNPFAESKTPKTQGEKMREYIEKVTATMDGGLVGGRTGETMPAPKEGKSPISSGSGKPTSGANASNIATDMSTHDEDGTAPKGKIGGLLKKGGDVPHAGNFLNTEKSGQKAKGMFSQAKKPANGEGKPVGAGSGQSNVTGATNTKSIESGK